MFRKTEKIKGRTYRFLVFIIAFSLTNRSGYSLSHYTAITMYDTGLIGQVSDIVLFEGLLYGFICSAIC